MPPENSLELNGRGRIVEDPYESARARRTLLEKCQSSYSGDLTSWSRDGLLISIDIRGSLGAAG